MWKENLYQPVEILLREHDEFPIGEHRHSFVEIVYILEGNGKFHAYTLGDEKECHGYMAGDLYLIPPERVHRFTIDSHSRYVFIRFTRNYVSDYINSYIEKTLEIQSGFRIQPSGPDRGVLCSLMGMTETEAANRQGLSGLLLQYYVNSIILIISRSLSEMMPIYDHTDNDKAHYMLQYIQQHIHQPELLKLEVLAEKFHLSPVYAGRFFKRNFGEDFRRYVSMNRLRKVEEMLVNTRMSIKEIAARMGYIDSCYLNKLFRQYHGMTPAQFRKHYLNIRETIS